MSLHIVLARLLDYPSNALLENMDELRTLAIENNANAGVLKFMDDLSNGDLLALQGSYVDTFDMDAKFSLHITHHLYGEERERGLAMADLNEFYAGYGIKISNGELPDFLPLLLEFLTVIPPEEAQDFLDKAANAIGILGGNLAEANSPYAVIIDAVLNLTNRIPMAGASSAKTA
jgi:nitrate reductase delta subunit